LIFGRGGARPYRILSRFAGTLAGQNVGDDLADLHLGAFRDEDFKRAGSFGKDLGGDLVRLNLEQWIAGGDGVSVLPLPTTDHAGGNGFADGGNFDSYEVEGGGAHFFLRLS
jgi:hypothetical protein